VVKELDRYKYSAQSPTSGQEAMEILTGSRKKIRDLTSIVDQDEHRYIGGGMFGDVYRGIWKDGGKEERYPEIVVKVLRSTGSVDSKLLTKRFKV
jgi:hypothetical protein